MTEILIWSFSLAWEPGRHGALVYHNNGDGTFSRVSGGGVTNQFGHLGDCKFAAYEWTRTRPVGRRPLVENLNDGRRGLQGIFSATYSG